MDRALKLEEVALFGLSIYLFSLTDFTWSWYLALILLPDIGMIGYLISTKIGAYSYNLFHHRGIAVGALLLGWYMKHDWLALSGIILFGHCAMDRMLGYGLKFEDSFHHTHLGWLKPQGKDIKNV